MGRKAQSGAEAAREARREVLLPVSTRNSRLSAAGFLRTGAHTSWSASVESVAREHLVKTCETRWPSPARWGCLQRSIHLKENGS
ncbi:hypothetical protein DBR06_SOUSAS510196 [Sousa chinensis]|nr:hypothetical protein DBR06_SOUSAS510196 [Sousa chinensis]